MLQQASIWGLQNKKNKKYQKLENQWSRFSNFEILKSQIRIKHQSSRKPKTAKERIKILFRCEELKDRILQNENHHA